MMSSHISGTADAPCKSTVRRVAAQLNRAMSEKGLALLVNHGISDDKLRAVYDAFDNFCDLPEDVKNTFRRTSPCNHGYVPPGTERFSSECVEEMRHAFNICWLDRNLPDAEVQGFQAVVTTLAQDFQKLAALLLRALASSLDLQAEYFLDSHRNMFQEGNESCMRLLYYPPFGAPPTPGVTRCGEHSDYGTFTLLAQDCEGGLEVQTSSHRWGRVGHLPGSILVNTGELLASWTNNKYPALRHRVVVPEQPKIRSKARHSIAFFVHPGNDTPITPIQCQVTEAEHCTTNNCIVKNSKSNHPKQNTIYTAYQHLQMRFRETYAS
ncbi:Gibberellin 20 oxidase 1 [Zootermopsis nevadensis]|uniref:Gibberellin 20 oxidase 1 n=1 Tax=Zootermopsis nevadensis TaxID=136037 RepID=A0A067QJW5_ZOONE|nr:Gibberellin 20 oxidase 1 [Zootermopsis nevadensis]